MINHVRNLLLNQSRDGIDLDFPGEQYVPPAFLPRANMPRVLTKIRGILFGSDPDQHMLNYRTHQLLQVLHSTELDEHVRAFDPRITYLPLNNSLYTEPFRASATLTTDAVSRFVLPSPYYVTDGSGRITVEPTADLSFGDGVTDTPFTLTGWVYIQDDGFHRAAISKWGDDGHEWAISHFDGATGFHFSLEDAAGNQLSGQANVAAVFDTWIHIAVTYDGTPANTKLFLDGVEIPWLLSLPGSWTALGTTAQHVRLGDYGATDAFDYELEGRLDEWRIYHRTLSATELGILMAGGEPSITDLVAYWPMNTLDDGVVVDLINGYNGTPSSSTAVVLDDADPAITRIVDAETAIATIGELRANDAAGKLRHWWEVEVVSDSLVNVKRLVPPLQSQAYAYTLTNLRSNNIPLLGSSLLFNFTGEVGSKWFVEAVTRPSRDTGELLAELAAGLTETDQLQLFGVAPAEPMLTYRNLFQQHEKFAYRLGGVVMAMVHRMDELSVQAGAA